MMFGSLALAIIWMSPPVLVGPDVTLRWTQREGAAACIDDRALAAAVTARLGGAPDRGHSRIVIDGEIAPVEPAAAGAGWTAAIRTADARGHALGERELHETAADCHAIDDKLVLVIALIIDPALLDSAPASPPPPASPASPERPRAIAATSIAVPPPREPWRFGASVAALATGGMLPGIAFGSAIAVRLDPPRGWPVELSATVWPRDRAFAAAGGATLLELTGGAAVCPHVVGPVSACVGAQAGEVRARGFGYDQNQLQHELVVDGTVELRLDWRLGAALGARVGAAAWVPVSRPRFVVQESSADVMVYQPAVVALVSGITVWTRF
jgi:hypothetical protein